MDKPPRHARIPSFEGQSHRITGENLRKIFLERHIFQGIRSLAGIADRKTPATSETAVLQNGIGSLVKRGEIAPLAEPPKLRPVSANSAYELHDRLADEAHMVEPPSEPSEGCERHDLHSGQGGKRLVRAPMPCRQVEGRAGSAQVMRTN